MDHHHLISHFTQHLWCVQALDARGREIELARGIEARRVFHLPRTLGETWTDHN